MSAAETHVGNVDMKLVSAAEMSAPPVGGSWQPLIAMRKATDAERVTTSRDESPEGS